MPYCSPTDGLASTYNTPIKHAWLPTVEDIHNHSCAMLWYVACSLPYYTYSHFLHGSNYIPENLTHQVLYNYNNE